MKKNILLVQSFLLVPLISSSFSFSMEQNPTSTYATVVQKGTQLPQPPLKQSGSKKRKKKKLPIQKQELAQATSEEIEIAPTQPIASKDYFSDEDKLNAKKDLKIATNNINTMPGIYDLLTAIQAVGGTSALNPVSIISSVEQPQTPVKIENLKIQVVDDLADSILSPSERSELAISQRIWNSWRSNRTIALELLTTKTFEAHNAVHTEYFNKALEECAQHKDLLSLKAIMDACQAEEYKMNMQSAINHVAPVFNYLCDEYQAQIDASNKALIDYNQQCAMQMNEEAARLKANMVQLLNQHRNSVSGMAKAFEAKTKEESAKVEGLKTLVHEVCALNRKVALRENELIFALPLVVPTNSVGKIEEATHKNIRHLLTNSNMPQAKTNILQIDNK